MKLRNLISISFAHEMANIYENFSWISTNHDYHNFTKGCKSIKTVTIHYVNKFECSIESLLLFIIFLRLLFMLYINFLLNIRSTPIYVYISRLILHFPNTIMTIVSHYSIKTNQSGLFYNFCQKFYRNRTVCFQRFKWYI